MEKACSISNIIIKREWEECIKKKRRTLPISLYGCLSLPLCFLYVMIIFILIHDSFISIPRRSEKVHHENESSRRRRTKMNWIQCFTLLIRLPFRMNEYIWTELSLSSLLKLHALLSMTWGLMSHKTKWSGNRNLSFVCTTNEPSSFLSNLSCHCKQIPILSELNFKFPSLKFPLSLSLSLSITEFLWWFFHMTFEIDMLYFLEDVWKINREEEKESFSKREKGKARRRNGGNFLHGKRWISN